MIFRTRFAPSPTGPLHLGHAYSALLGHDMAQSAGGEFLLRIEDIDSQRSKAIWEDAIYEDLRWLGLTWPTPVMRQSDRLPIYRDMLQRLWQRGLLYPCTCTRKDIEAAASAPQEGVAPTHGPDGRIYPGTCRATANRAHEMPLNLALRLDMRAALTAIGQDDFDFTETGSPQPTDFCEKDLTQGVGDIVLSRKDFPGSYHLSVVLDDAAQGITHVVRGEDLFEATRIHVVLQHLLGLPTPVYHHHPLIRDENGKRLAKRDDARALSRYRGEGMIPEDIRSMTGL